MPTYVYQNVYNNDKNKFALQPQPYRPSKNVLGCNVPGSTLHSRWPILSTAKIIPLSTTNVNKVRVGNGGRITRRHGPTKSRSQLAYTASIRWASDPPQIGCVVPYGNVWQPGRRAQIA
ncbi:hypothetical protein M404DRAFT_995584 [Pisolithus tinctorius Marx 270]|uniref:Uncharacterized protein n=1 Tax=Pisolithus tinctorius Marx 270 TaxID=870435 RepID=A0A0C3PNH1_PISTI|nr:hypothetical protein M404DRAFT_995584 [Pisolithus tinctorius Marx 270]